jgi:hypothetical protein
MDVETLGWTERFVLTKSRGSSEKNGDCSQGLRRDLITHESTEYPAFPSFKPHPILAFSQTCIFFELEGHVQDPFS